MRSLFAKILLWFLATILVAFVGFSVIAPGQLQRSHAPAAHGARVSVSGPRGERSVRSRWAWRRFDGISRGVKEIFQADAMLTDANGRDLVTGEDRSDLIAGGPPARILSAGTARSWRAKRPMDATGLFSRSSNEADARVEFPIGQLWVLGAVVLLCYLLARYLTAPLRALQTALERFGQGDFSARTGSTRRDELGQLARTFDQMAERIQNLVAPNAGCCWISHTSCARRWPGWASRSSWRALERIAMRRSIAFKRKSDRLNALVDELLQATRAEVDPKALRAQPVRLDDLLAAHSE